ncbi:hypothetical protein JR316_0012358 [Psilocybe cubensis]|nr:hypothetical protein JR316_0012358 [Psilocybe cubensis]KAH9475247.1 hypothetical protein JR316_0012358 [Psilocybe cubensis]
MNSQNQRASSSARSGQLEQSSSAASDLWFYNQQNSPKGAQQPATSSSMIPPTSSYYNPDDIHQNENQGQYQQWLDSFHGGSQQQQQQPQQVEYSSSYRRPTAPAPTVHQSGQSSFNFMQGQYASGSMNQYAASTPDTVTQGAVSGTSTYQSQSSDIYSAFYPEMLSMSNNSSAPSPENAHSYHTSTTPESAVHSYSNTPDPVYQQQQFSQQQQPSHLSSGQIEQKPSQSSQFLVPQTARYLPSQRNRSDFGTPVSNSNASSHASSLSPPPNIWTNESIYSTKKADTSSAGHQSQQSKIRDNQVSAGKAGPSQINRVIPSSAKRPDGSAKTASPPRPGAAAATTTAAAGAKRKRAKRDDHTEWSNNQGSRYAAEDASDSESDDDDDGTGLGMSGAIGVGLGGLGVVGKGGKKEVRSRL